MAFVHLHLHSQYSLLESSVTFDDVIELAKAFNMPAVALTDLGNMFGVVEFYFGLKSAGIKPILGQEVFLRTGQSGSEKLSDNDRLVLLAIDFSGYQNLCKISSHGFENVVQGRPRVGIEFIEKHNSQLIALAGGWYGDLARIFRQSKDGAAVEERVARYLKIFGDRLYLEINRNAGAEQAEFNKMLMEIAQRLRVKLVAANECFHLRQDDQIVQEALMCIGKNKTLTDPTRFRLDSGDFYFKSPKEMEILFSDMPEAIAATREIADRCNVVFKIKDEAGKPIYHLPKFPTTLSDSPATEIELLARQGLAARLAQQKKLGIEHSAEVLTDYSARLEREIKVIQAMGFDSYFLIVQDFIAWAKSNGIPVGPGRGSGAGSLVAYSLGITDLDPMPYNLIFERFLNPERISMPDFDIDFCQERRSEVIHYVTKKYGDQSVSQIITFGKLQTRAAIRDVGRVLGMAYGEVDAVAKLVPERLGISIKEAVEEEPRLREAMNLDPRVDRLIQLALRVEGLVRHAGIHAAGVIISDGSIDDQAPLYRGIEGENVVQYDMKHAEKLGLIKFDFLGLKTLTHINDAIKLIERNRGVKLSVQDISLSDPGIYKIMADGDTGGIFQFEGDGITDLLRKSRPKNFEDIVAANALFRPGPMDMIPEYLLRRENPKRINFYFPELEPVLKETFGVIVYQEQVQLIAAKIASYSLGEADLLRRAMGKKNPEEMAQQKERFLNGAKKNGFNEKKSEELFELMAEFAKYGFNKSHAAAYCVVAAHTAYLKNRFPVEFFAALLSTEMNDTDKVLKYIRDAQRHKIKIETPHINHSHWKFEVEGDIIFYSLGAIKGVGEAAAELIVQVRESLPNSRFETVFDFFKEVDLKRVNKKAIEALIKAGAFDGMGYSRAALLQNYPVLVEDSLRTRAEREMGQSNLFAMMDDQSESIKEIPNTQDWSKTLKLLFEKEVLGFYLSEHPMEGMDGYLRNFVTHKISDLAKLEENETVQVAGLVLSAREILTKKQTKMAFVQFEDATGQIELIVFPNVYKDYGAALKADTLMIASGEWTIENQSRKLIVEKIEPLENTFKKAQFLNLQVGKGFSVEELKRVLDLHRGTTPVFLQMQIDEPAVDVTLKVNEPAGVLLSKDLVESLLSTFGENLQLRFVSTPPTH